MKRKLILYPFFIAVYPVLYLYSVNYRQIDIELTFRSLVVALAVCSLLMALIFFLLKDWQRAGMLTTLLLILFFTYGHLELFLINQLINWLTDWPAQPVSFLLALIYLAISKHVIVLLWCGVAVLGIRWIFRIKSNNGTNTLLLNSASLFLLILPGIYLLPLLSPAPTRTEDFSSRVADGQLPGNLKTNSPIQYKPDIYYVILDGYGQGSMLKDIYSFDNSVFLDELKDRGFKVSQESHSNYIQTVLSVASSLNMNYLDNLIPASIDMRDRKEATNLLQKNQLVQFLKSQGYRTFIISSGFEPTNKMDVDEVIIPDENLNSFEKLLVSRTILSVFTGTGKAYEYREKVKLRFHLLAELSKQPGPKFIFVHFVIPHPPFVFDHQGNPVGKEDIAIFDGSDLGLDPEDYQLSYQEQVLYINQMILLAVDQVLANSEQDPIIVLQGDHGPASYLDWNSPENSCIRERTSILNAYHLPGKEITPADNITPVNSFRFILDHYFGTQLGELGNRYYYSPISTPLKFIDVGEQLETCATLEKDPR